MSEQLEQVYKEKFAQQLQAIKESHDSYVAANRKLLDVSRESVHDLLDQMRQWLLPFAVRGLLHIRLEPIVCFKEIFGEFDTYRLIIKLSDNRSIVVEPYALDATVACSNLRMTFARSVQDIRLSWDAKKNWCFKSYPFDGLRFSEPLFFACLGEFTVIREETLPRW